MHTIAVHSLLSWACGTGACFHHEHMRAVLCYDLTTAVSIGCFSMFLKFWRGFMKSQTRKYLFVLFSKL